MAGALRFVRGSAKRAPLSFCAKVSMAVFLALCFAVIWSAFSPSSPSAVSSRRDSFDDISVSKPSLSTAAAPPSRKKNHSRSYHKPASPKDEKKEAAKDKEKPHKNDDEIKPEVKTNTNKPERSEERAEEEEEEKRPTDGLDDASDGQIDADPDVDADLEEGIDVSQEEETADESDAEKKRKKKKKKLGPLFDPAAQYEWKLCGGRGMQNYIPCVDMEGMEKLRNHRHHERSCPRAPVMCLVPLPQGYGPPPPWPERESKVFYKNVAHPKLSAFIKSHSWLNLSGEYLTFPQDQSEFKGGALHYLESIEEMVPDIDLGKNIRVILDIGCKDASFSAAVLEKGVITLSFGLMNDQTDLAQLALERGYPAVVGNLGTRRLPFPSGVFDAIHCSECNIPWHSNGGRLLLEMNRILRPGGYFIFSSSHGDADSEEGMSTLTAAICWNILAHKTDEVSEFGVKIYQRPASNDIYELRRRKEPPLCKEDENQDAAWYTPVRTCLHKVPAAIEERGTDWPEEWPKRLDSIPEWLGDSREKLSADSEHWKAIVNKSYLTGMGIDWENIRNIMDMKAIFGGFAAALASHKVWVMNVVPVHAPNTLPIIYERGLLGIYHDWCEPFSTYPRSYDLLHADHLFSRLKNRCKQPTVIVVEMDRILRPGGWAIIRDKLEILNPLENIFNSMHWDIRMTYGKDREGIICVQKTTWRP